MVRAWGPGGGAVSVVGLARAGAGVEAGAGIGVVAESEAGVVAGPGAVTGAGVEAVSETGTGVVAVTGAGAVTGAETGTETGITASTLAATAVSLAEGSVSLVGATGDFSDTDLGAGFTAELSTGSFSRLCPMVSPVTGHTEG